MTTLIQNGWLVLPQGVTTGDILIEGSVIKKIAPHIEAQAQRVLDAAGCYVFPGFIDTHTHFDLELPATTTADNFITGTRAAVVGGTTTVLDFATQDRGMTMQEALEKWHRKAAGSSCHYGFHMAVSEWNRDRIEEIDSMMAQGVTSFKMYMVYDNMKVDDGQMYEAVKLLADKDCIVGVHCENDDIIKARVRELHQQGKLAPVYHAQSRPNLVEADGVARLMDICALAHAPAWVVHLSTAEGLAEAEKARRRGQEVYLESCPQYMVLEEKDYLAEDGEKFIMSPPLRSKKDQEALLQSMGKNGIDWIGTDHCSFTMAQKAMGEGDFSKVPNGGAGVQNRAEIVYTRGVKGGYITIEQMGKLLSENAARLFGMYPQKGVLQEGSDADIVLFDPNCPHEIHAAANLHHCDNSPYEGYEAAGKTRDVLLKGELVVQNGRLILPGKGEYVFRNPCERYRR